MDLESRNAAILAELSSPTRATTSSSSSAPFIPRAPARHTLTSHRAPITRVAFHPTWTVLASASEDASVKIWDWEGGEFERTVKGHTKAVMDVDFDLKGTMMGEPVLLQPEASSTPWTSLTPSHVLVRFDHKAVGSSERVHQYQNAAWSRSLGLHCAVHSRRREASQCE